MVKFNYIAIYFLTFTLLFLQVSSILQFEFDLERNERQCLSEFFPELANVFIEVHSSNEFTDVTLQSPDGRVIEEKSNIREWTDAFSTYEGGYYQVCIFNRNSSPTSVSFMMKTGIAAKDFTQIVTKKDMKPLDQNLQALVERSKEITQLHSFAQIHETVFENLSEQMQRKVILFSSVVIVIMIVIALTETFYLKRYLLNKKLI